MLYAIFAITLADRRFGGVYQENFFYSYSIGAAYVCAALVFIAFAAFGERMAWRSMAFVGSISYSVYLMSPFVIVWIHRLVWLGDGPLGWAAFAALVAALSILVSWRHTLSSRNPASRSGTGSGRSAGSRSLSSRRSVRRGRLSD